MKEVDTIIQQTKFKFSWRILGENFVFQQGNHFYKMPSALYKNTMYRHSDSYEKVIDALKLIKQYFGPIVIIPETKIFKDKQDHYVIKQAKIPGVKLTKKHLKNNPKLISKFARIVIANELMWQQQGFFLDILGSDILTHPNTIHNLFTNGEDIYIFDFGLLEKSSKNIFFKYFSRFGTWIQLRFMKRFF